MSTSKQRECLCCGMLQQVNLVDIHDRGSEEYCEKCDNPLLAQSDGSTLTVDIAHNRETVPQALDKFERVLNRGWRGHAGQVRLVVGGGEIRDAILAELYFLQSKGTVLSFKEGDNNRGAILVRIRDS